MSCIKALFSALALLSFATLLGVPVAAAIDNAEEPSHVETNSIPQIIFDYNVWDPDCSGAQVKGFLGVSLPEEWSVIGAAYIMDSIDSYTLFDFDSNSEADSQAAALLSPGTGYKAKGFYTNQISLDAPLTGLARITIATGETGGDYSIGYGLGFIDVNNDCGGKGYYFLDSREKNVLSTARSPMSWSQLHPIIDFNRSWGQYTIVDSQGWHVASEMDAPFKGIQYIFRPHGGDWQNHYTLLAPEGSSYTDPIMQISEDGVIHMLYTSFLSLDRNLVYVSLNNGSWSTPEVIDDNIYTTYPGKSMIYSDGVLHISWEGGGKYPNDKIKYITRNASTGTYSDEETVVYLPGSALGHSVSPGYQGMDLDSAGTPHIVYDIYNDLDANTFYYTHRIDYNNWSTPLLLLKKPSGFYMSKIIIDSDDVIHVSTMDNEDWNSFLYAYKPLSDSSWPQVYDIPLYPPYTEGGIWRGFDWTHSMIENPLSFVYDTLIDFGEGVRWNGLAAMFKDYDSFSCASHIYNDEGAPSDEPMWVHADYFNGVYYITFCNYFAEIGAFGIGYAVGQPFVKIISPNSGSVSGSTNISWSVADYDSNSPGDSVSLTFYYDEDTNPENGRNIISTATTLIEESASGSYSWSLADVVPGYYYVCVDANTANLSGTDCSDSMVYVSAVSEGKGGLPDLIVEEALMSKSNALPGEIVSLSAVIGNTGDSIARGFEVSVFLESSDGNVVVASQEVDALLAGNSKEIEFSFSAPGTMGLNVIKVVVDPDNAVREANENNNAALLSLTVMTAPLKGPVQESPVEAPATPPEPARPPRPGPTIPSIRGEPEPEPEPEEEPAKEVEESSTAIVAVIVASSVVVVGGGGLLLFKFLRPPPTPPIQGI